MFAVLLAGALAAAVLAPGQLASWADAHADRPGGQTLAVALHQWNDLLAPLDQVRQYVHGRSQQAVERRF